MEKRFISLTEFELRDRKIYEGSLNIRKSDNLDGYTAVSKKDGDGYEIGYESSTDKILLCFYRGSRPSCKTVTFKELEKDYLVFK